MKEKLLHDVIQEEIQTLVTNAPNLWPCIQQQITRRNTKRVIKSRPFHVKPALMSASFFIILIVFLIWQPWTTSVSAQEILSKTSHTWMMQLEDVDYLYQRIRISGSDIAMMPSGTVEIWRSLDGHQLRFEMRDNHNQLIYFLLQNGDELWLSLNMDPINTSPVSAIYLSSIEQQTTKINNQFSIFGLVGLASPSQDCFSLECFLDNLSLYQLFGNLVLNIEETEIGEMLSIEWINHIPLDEGSEETLEQVWTIKVDPQDYHLIQFTNPYGHVWEFLEHKGVTSEDLPEATFSSFPEEVELLDEWEHRAGLVMDPADNLWVVSVTQREYEPTTHIQRFTVEVGYQLVSRPEAIISLHIDPTLIEDQNYPFNGIMIEHTDGDEIGIPYGQGVVTFELNIVTDQPWDGSSIPLLAHLFTHELGVLGATYDIIFSLNTSHPINQ